MSEKDSAQQAREHECRVRELARHILTSIVSGPLTGVSKSKTDLTDFAWELAAEFEAQAEERWRKLL